jgi:transposase
MVMNTETWAEIRRLSAVDRLSLSEIGRRLMLDRKTVRAALRSETCTGPAQISRPSKLDAYKPYIEERLKKYRGINCVRLLRELRQMEYTGGISILKEYIACVRPKAAEAFFRIETLPGEQGQVDWANCGVIRVGGAVRKLSAFVMVMSYSRMMYVELTMSQCLEDFLGAHVRAFKYFGGIPGKLLYDNLKSVCLARLGSEIRFNPKFMEFSGHYLFQPVLCRPAHGNEKGKVESGIKYLRGSFLDGRPMDDWVRLREDLNYWLEQTANRREHATTRMQPAERFLEEKGVLRPLPEREPDTAIVRAVQATSQAYVHFDGNMYSVPFVFARKVMTLKAGTHEINVFHKARPVALHSRSYGRGVITENPKHYAGLLELKKAARSAKASDGFLSLGAGSEPVQAMLEAYMKGLLGADINIHAHLARILGFAGLYGRTEVLQAIERALKFSVFSAGYIENIIIQSRAARGESEIERLSIPGKPDWEHAAVPERDLSTYDKIFEVKQDEKKDEDPTKP